MSDQSCGNCRYWDGGPDDPVYTKAWCQRYPPAVLHISGEGDESNLWLSWPKMMPHQWCGEWQRHPSLAPEVPNRSDEPHG